MDPHWEAIVVGSGLAGLTLALSLAPRKTLLITKTPHVEGGSTVWAQGGIAFPQGKSDIPVHIHDTLLSSAGKADEAAVKELVEQASPALHWLEALGLVFDHDEKGYLLGQEGAHSIRRILHIGGDSTGKEISLFLSKKVRTASHITLMENTLVLALEKEKETNNMAGVWCLGTDQQLKFISSTQVFLAGGGLGQLFTKTTNPPESTGDTLALAKRAGLPLRDMEMIQFHPTALAVSLEGKRPQLPLLSEALRGEGGLLVYKEDQNFKRLPINHPKGELAPRDIVARSIFQQIQKGFSIGLDVRALANFEQHFPTITQICHHYGLDPHTDILPVAPAVHYTMGGIPTNLRGETAIPGLWAVGECASSGVHGANRLASNSLLECLVFARLATAQHTPVSAKSFDPPRPALNCLNPTLPDMATINSFEIQLQNLMFASAGPVRNRTLLTQGGMEVDKLFKNWLGALEPNKCKQLPSFEERKAVFELENLFLLAKEVLTHALENEQSCGAHFRQDND